MSNNKSNSVALDSETLRNFFNIKEKSTLSSIGVAEDKIVFNWQKFLKAANFECDSKCTESNLFQWIWSFREKCPHWIIKKRNKNERALKHTQTAREITIIFSLWWQPQNEMTLHPMSLRQSQRRCERIYF